MTASRELVARARKALGVGRSVAIVALGATLIAGQLWAMAAKQEFWPLSNYPMYAGTQGKHVSALEIEGVRRDGSRYRIAIREELAPFDPSRILGFVRRVGRGEGGEERAVATSRALLALYETHRKDGRTHGPELAELEIYEASYRIASGATNRREPDRRRLVASTRGGGAE